MAEVSQRLRMQIRLWAQTHPYGILMSQLKEKQQ